MVAVLIICPIVILLVLGGITYFMIKRVGTAEGTAEKNATAASVKDFLPLAEVDGPFLKMKDGRKVIVLECDSIGYDLQTAEEQESIEQSFKGFLHSLSFPISFFIQTRIIDNTKRMAGLRIENEKTVAQFPDLKDYSQKYIAAMSKINETLGESKEKKKFIIIPYNDTLDIEEMSEVEKNVHIEKELFDRADTISGGLANTGVRCRVLGERDLIELLYTSFNREGFAYAENLSKLESLSLFVHKADREKDYSSTRHAVLTDFRSLINALDLYPEAFGDIDVKDVDKLNDIYAKCANGQERRFERYAEDKKE